MNVFDITLDVDKRTNKESVTLRQGDMHGTTIRATLLDHEVPIEGGEYTAMFCMTLPDRRTFYHDDATYEDGVVTVVVDEQHAAAVPGVTNNAYFELYDGDELKYTTASFVVRIKPSSMDGHAAQSYDPRVEAIMSEMRELIDSVTAAEEEREAAEQERASAFVESEQARSDAFDASELSRQQEYESAETQRQNAFHGFETERSGAFAASETQRSRDFNLAESARSDTFSLNERNRQRVTDEFPTRYVSRSSFASFCAGLEQALNIRIVESWNTATNQYDFIIVSGS